MRVQSEYSRWIPWFPFLSHRLSTRVLCIVPIRQIPYKPLSLHWFSRIVIVSELNTRIPKFSFPSQMFPSISESKDSLSMIPTKLESEQMLSVIVTFLSCSTRIPRTFPEQSFHESVTLEDCTLIPDEPFMRRNPEILTLSARMTITPPPLIPSTMVLPSPVPTSSRDWSTKTFSRYIPPDTRITSLSPALSTASWM